MRLSGVPAICLLTLVTVAAMASSAAAQALAYGAKGGVDLTRVHFGTSFSPDTGASAGVAGGGFVGWKLTGRLSLRGEVLVAQERVTFESVIADTFRTLQVPVLIRYRAASLVGHIVHLSAGVVALRVLDAREAAGGESASIADGTTRSSQALALGGSIGLWRRWTADVRYLQGRKGLYKKIGGGAEGKTRTLQMTVEYQF